MDDERDREAERRDDADELAAAAREEPDQDRAVARRLADRLLDEIEGNGADQDTRPKATTRPIVGR